MAYTPEDNKEKRIKAAFPGEEIFLADLDEPLRGEAPIPRLPIRRGNNSFRVERIGASAEDTDKGFLEFFEEKLRNSGAAEKSCFVYFYEKGQEQKEDLKDVARNIQVAYGLGFIGYEVEGQAKNLQKMGIDGNNAVAIFIDGKLNSIVSSSLVIDGELSPVVKEFLEKYAKQQEEVVRLEPEQKPRRNFTPELEPLAKKDEVLPSSFDIPTQENDMNEDSNNVKDGLIVAEAVAVEGVVFETLSPIKVYQQRKPDQRVEIIVEPTIKDRLANYGAAMNARFDRVASFFAPALAATASLIERMEADHSKPTLVDGIRALNEKPVLQRWRESHPKSDKPTKLDAMREWLKPKPVEPEPKNRKKIDEFKPLWDRLSTNAKRGVLGTISAAAVVLLVPIGKKNDDKAVSVTPAEPVAAQVEAKSKVVVVSQSERSFPKAAEITGLGDTKYFVENSAITKMVIVDAAREYHDIKIDEFLKDAARVGTANPKTTVNMVQEMLKSRQLDVKEVGIIISWVESNAGIYEAAQKQSQEQKKTTGAQR